MMMRLLAAGSLLMGCGPANDDATRSEIAAPSKAEEEPDVKAVGTTDTESEPRADPEPPLPAASPDSVTPAEPKPEAAEAPTFNVVARLVDAGTPTSHCGVMHFKVVMKYEVLRVVDGHFAGETLYAGVSCPEMPPTRTRKFRFVVGDTYELKLRTAGLRREGAKVDAFEGEPGKRYELLHIEPAS